MRFGLRYAPTYGATFARNGNFNDKLSTIGSSVAVHAHFVLTLFATEFDIFFWSRIPGLDGLPPALMANRAAKTIHRAVDQCTRIQMGSWLNWRSSYCGLAALEWLNSWQIRRLSRNLGKPRRSWPARPAAARSSFRCVWMTAWRWCSIRGYASVSGSMIGQGLQEV